MLVSFVQTNGETGDWRNSPSPLKRGVPLRLFYGGVIRLVEGANEKWDFFGGYHIWLRDRKGAHMIYVGAVSRSEDNPDLQEALGRFYSHIAKVMQVAKEIEA